MTNRLTKTALMEHIKAAGLRADQIAPERHERASTFIAALCGRLEYQHLDIAREIAKGAGMGHLYESEK
jgi:hypothetical protein